MRNSSVWTGPKSGYCTLLLLSRCVTNVSCLWCLSCRLATRALGCDVAQELTLICIYISSWSVCVDYVVKLSAFDGLFTSSPVT